LDGFVNIVKATRVYRTFPSLMVMMISMAFANIINKEIIVLSLCCVLVYASAGIYNAIRDKDYMLPEYSKKVVWGLIIISLLLSLSNYIIFFTVITAISLGFIYNTISRFLLFGDTTVLSVTHYALPSFSSSMVLGLDKRFALTLTVFMLITSWFIMPLKNLKDTSNDKNRGYKTLTTITKHGKRTTIILFGLFFIPTSFAYFLFNLTKIYLFILALIFILELIIMINIIKNKEGFALKLARAMVLLFLFGLIISKATDIRIVLVAFYLFLVYCLFLIKEIISPVKMHLNIPKIEKFVKG